MALILKNRAFAGVWFMAAGVIPTFFIAMLLLNTTDFAGNSFIQSRRAAVEFVFWFIFIPLVLTGILGSLLAAGILDPQKLRGGWQSALRGLLVLVTAFLLFSVVISLRETSENGYQTFLRTWILMLMFGSVAVGWLVVMVGILAGWLLYKRQAIRMSQTNLS
jgi:hypothetical protein